MYHLRELEKKDLEKINIWRNDPELLILLGAPFRYINKDVDFSWYENYIKNRGNTIRCAITENESDMILGLISLVCIDFMNQSAELHIMIGDEQFQGHGIGSFAVNTMLEHAFQNLNLHRIELSVLDTNHRAKNLYEKIGFIKEGLKRKVKYKNGKFVDMILYAMLKEEFEIN